MPPELFPRSGLMGKVCIRSWVLLCCFLVSRVVVVLQEWEIMEWFGLERPLR